MAHYEDTELRPYPRDTTTLPEIPPTQLNACPATFRSTVQEVVFVLTATMGVAMPSFLQECSIVISSFVGRDLDMTTSQITWMTASSRQVFPILTPR